MHSQPIKKKDEKRRPEVINNKKEAAMRSDAPGRPVRVAIYVEMGGAGVSQVQNLIAQIRSQYPNAANTHYVIPVRNGKLKTEIEFEHEFLSTIREVCTVDTQGQIVFKDGAQDVRIFRETIGPGYAQDDNSNP
jgi:hypothetical protein